jgi:hypothetical protein
MKRIAAALLLLCACSKEDYKNQKPPEEEAPAVEANRRPPPPPPKKVLTPEELGKCELEAKGAVTAEQTTFGGRKATNVSYWLSEAERKNMMGIDGFAVNCQGPDIDFRILPGGGKKDGMPFEPKKYEIKKGTGDANVMVMFGKRMLEDVAGTVDITTFDKKSIAGTIDLKGKLEKGGGSVELTGSFDFQCPGFSACEN